MREILFRGKRVDNGEWVEGGSLIQIWENTKKVMEIIPKGTEPTINQNQIVFQGCNVIPETVGQYTGLIDKNGTRIFEGDLVKCGKYVLLVDWEECTGYHPFNAYGCTPEECEVIGNIHDNPKLLEGE